MKGLIRFRTTLHLGMSTPDSDVYSLQFETQGGEGFADGQRVLVTVEALEEPGE